MKRKEELLENINVEFYRQKSRRYEELKKVRETRISTEIREFMGEYYATRGQFLPFILDDDDRYPHGMYFSVICSRVASREARQWLINYFDLYRVSHPADATVLMNTWDEWPPSAFAVVYGYIPPIRKLITHEECTPAEVTC